MIDEYEDCIFTGLMGTTKCTPALRERYPRVCSNCGHNPDKTTRESKEKRIDV